LAVDGKPPLEVLETMVDTLNEYDRKLLRTSLFLGIEMDPLKDDPGQGDFLIRNLMGVDRETGSLVVGALLREGQLVQFHLRDKVMSSEDLKVMLSRYQSKDGWRDAKGALLFSCLGRGEHLYGQPNHDSDLFKTKMGDIPLGGFFCNGEIGPVGKTTFLHGYTSSFGIFRPS
ncbi:MAG: FIST C-terminal domain-containing protein, partial [Nitrospinae bacterium]|nr:FIST C-terminal domain-containing protein [Nitrospinota bacterium]